MDEVLSLQRALCAGRKGRKGDVRSGVKWRRVTARERKEPSCLVGVTCELGKVLCQYHCSRDGGVVWKAVAGRVCDLAFGRVAANAKEKG